MKKNNFTTSNINLKKIILFSVFALICFILSLNYFNQLELSFVEKFLHRELRDPSKWSRILKDIIHIPLLFSLLYLFLITNNYGLKIKDNLKNNFNVFFQYLKENKILFFELSFFFFIVYFRIITSDFYYMDDISRNHDGDRAWISFGRFISEFLSPVIHTTINLTDIAPLTQFISILFMAFSLLILSHILIKSKPSFIKILPLSLIFISPFYTQCFSYRFDNPYMTLSILFSLIPFLFIDDLFTFSYSSVFFLILSCMCYQSSTAIYIIFTIFYVLKLIITKTDNKKIFKLIIVSIISYILGLILYNIFLMSKPNPIYPGNDSDCYFSTAISISSIIFNIKQYFTILISSFGGLWIKIFTLISIIVFIISNTIKSNINKVVSFIFTILFLALALLLSLGPYMIFEKPLLEPRVYMGFNSFIAFILFFTLNNIEFKFSKHNLMFYVPCVGLIYGCIVFLFVLGNCYSQQKKYSDFRIELLLNDLNEFTNDKNIQVNFSGDIGYCQAFHIAQEKYPLISNLILVLPSNSNIWNYDYIYSYNYTYDEDTFTETLPLLKSTFYHDIYGANNKFLIHLKDNGNDYN